MRSRCRAEMTGPHTVASSAGSPVPILARVRAVICTASSYAARGTSSRVVIAQPCPACVAAAKAAYEQALLSA